MEMEEPNSYYKNSENAVNKKFDEINYDKNNSLNDVKFDINNKKKRDEQINFNITGNNNENDVKVVHEESIDLDLKVVEKFKVPASLKKTFIFSTVLFVVGMTLIAIGAITQVYTGELGAGITFWVLGAIVMIPGGYYSYQFCKARRTKSLEERDEILEQIPEL